MVLLADARCTVSHSSCAGWSQRSLSTGLLQLLHARVQMLQSRAVKWTRTRNDCAFPLAGCCATRAGKVAFSHSVYVNTADQVTSICFRPFTACYLMLILSIVYCRLPDSLILSTVHCRSSCDSNVGNCAFTARHAVCTLPWCRNGQVQRAIILWNGALRHLGSKQAAGV